MSLERFGDRWSLLIIRDLMVRGFRTFKEFQESGEGIATNILADRLRKLEAAGIISAETEETDGRRVNYRLTEKGIDLAPTMLELLIWGARNEQTGAHCALITEMEANREKILAEVRRRWRERDYTPLIPQFGTLHLYGDLNHVTISNAKAKETSALELEAPRFQDGKPLLIAGLRGHFTPSTWSGIGEQWRRFSSYIGRIPAQIGRTTYGLCFNQSDGIDYLSGVEVSSVKHLQEEISHATIPARRYAIFPHRGHVSQLYDTLEAIQDTWLPASGRKIAAASAGEPDFFERYGEGFDPRTGMGDIEVWIPIAPEK